MAESVPIRVLLVDDHVVVRSGLGAVLAVNDDMILVGEAGDGEEAVRCCERLKPDVILMDLLMPKMDGVSMLRKLHNSDWGKDIPVIMLTNLSDNEKVAESMANGSYDYLVKSNWKIEDIVKIVKNKLGI